MKKLLRLACLFFVLLLNGCLVGPNYIPPQNDIPDTWEGNIVIPTDETPLVMWWTIFNDPLLNRYIELALLYNNNVLTAEANILQARALKQVAASKLFPTINADFNALRIDLSKNGPLFGLARGGADGSSNFVNLFNALIDASWEIDLFGKTRRNIEASEALIGSAIEQRNDILLTVMAEIAFNYIGVRSNQKKASLIEENIRLLEQNSFIASQQLKSGYHNAIDLEKIETELATVRANLPTTYAQIYQGIYALSILTGDLPESLLKEMILVCPLPTVSTEIAIGLRSDLLRRRPDVRQAERQLAAATANIGVAVASFFPSISLLGVIGFDSLRLHNLFQANSKTWLADGNISLPLFQGGNLIGNLRATEAAMAVAGFTYQQAVLNALQDAQSALVAYTNELESAQELSKSVENNRKIVELTNARFTKGLVNRIDLLTSERELNRAEQNLLTSETAILVDLITLYKALGGGWEIAECG